MQLFDAHWIVKYWLAVCDVMAGPGGDKVVDAGSNWDTLDDLGIRGQSSSSETALLFL